MVLAGEKEFSIRDLNQKLTEQGLKSNPKTIQEILHFWATRLYAEKHIRGRTVRLSIPEDDDVRLPLRQRFEQRMALSDFIIKYLFEKYELERKRFEGGQAELGDELLVSEVKPATEVIAEVEEVIESGRKSKRPSEVIFSAYDLMDAYNNTPTTDHRFKPTVEDVQDALLYLHNIEALNSKGAFWSFTIRWKSSVWTIALTVATKGRNTASLKSFTFTELSKFTLWESLPATW